MRSNSRRSRLSAWLAGALIGAGATAVAVIPGSAVSPLATGNYTDLPPGTAPSGDGTAVDKAGIELGPAWGVYNPAPGFKASAPRASQWDTVDATGRTAKKMAVSFSANADLASADAVSVVARSGNSGQTWNTVGPSDWMALNMAKLADGSLLTVDFIPEWTDASHRNVVLVSYRSTDGGSTFTRSTVPVAPPAGTNWGPMERGLRVARGLYQLPDGTLLMPAYTQVTGDPAARVIILQSTDNGASWSVRSTIAKGTPTKNIVEPGISWTTDNRLIAIMRTDYKPVQVAPTELLVSYSDDVGQTWSTPTPLTTAGGTVVKGIDPNFSLQPNGMLLLSYGRPDNQLLVSEDGTGRSWTDHQVTFSNAFDTTTPIEQNQQRSYGSGGNTSILLVAANRSLLFYDTCITNNWCKSYNEQYGIQAKYIDAVTPGVGKIDVMSRLLDKTATVTGDFAAPNKIYPEQRAEGAFDGSSAERAATVLQRADGAAPSMVLRLDRPYRLDKLGIMLGTGQPLDADVQVSADGKAWGAPVLTIRGTQDRAMRYHDLTPVTAQYVKVTGKAGATTPVVELELYAQQLDTFENDAPFAIPRGFTGGVNATVTDVEAGGAHSQRSLRLLDRRYDQDATITKASPQAPYQSAEFQLAYEFGANPVYFSVVGTSAGKQTAPWQFRVAAPSSAPTLQVLNGGSWKSLGPVRSFPVTDAASNLGQWNTIGVEAGPSSATVTINGQRFPATTLRSEDADSLAGLQWRSDGLAPAHTELFIDDLYLAGHTQPAPKLAALTTSAAATGPGRPITVTSTLTNTASVAVNNAEAFLVTPAGWSTSTANLPGTLRPGQSVTVRWVVTPPAGTEPGSFQLHAQAGYSIGSDDYRAVSPSMSVSVGLVPREAMTATASSQQAPGNVASLAIDGKPDTFWHTQYSPSTPPLPQWITLDLGAPYNLNGLRYLPRQSGGSNGIITGYTISASTDGTTFTPVTSGSWGADAAEKSATFTARSARYLRLTATAGVGGFANAAELKVLGSPR
ncbi:discoidin domain-containing protein [Nakamurella aerolata]|uniref:F5/8 type C domain-containing protein n=1 Tax=Nakamurella aerolata TaxID=1656892 RepID=A0A849A9L9_9ACTN|nr:discoidin domain-containing protein [Nakamurella aerolata]NNG35180.1 hypothetical protein [Nakamurella aerolata]